MRPKSTPALQRCLYERSNAACIIEVVFCPSATGPEQWRPLAGALAARGRHPAISSHSPREIDSS